MSWSFSSKVSGCFLICINDKLGVIEDARLVPRRYEI